MDGSKFLFLKFKRGMHYVGGFLGIGLHRLPIVFDIGTGIVFCNVKVPVRTHDRIEAVESLKKSGFPRLVLPHETGDVANLEFI